MFKSNYSDSEKREILKERMVMGSSVRAICEKHDITVQTFYTWQRKFRCEDQARLNFESIIPETLDSTPEAENRILRRLYIDLSAHNYKLAQFLEK